MKPSTRILFLLPLLLTASIQASAGTSPFKVVHGPWIQNVTETSFTVLWTTEQKALCWVEVAPDDGTTWEQESRPKYYETCSGRRLTGTFHSITVDGPDAWYSQHWIAQHFTPVLNEAGIDMMISGHHHKYIVGQPGKYGNNFPIIVNSNNERLDFSATASKITIKTYNESGTLVHSLEY